MEKNTATVKVDKAENWDKAKNYVPDIFTIIVYEFDGASPKIKIGDGIHNVGSLPFLVRNEVNDTTLIL